MPIIKGVYQGESQSGKAYKIDNQWVAKSQMTNIKIEGNTISAEIPEWLKTKLDESKKKNPKKYNKQNYKPIENTKTYEPEQIYDNCKRCNNLAYINKQKLCVRCILDLANGITEVDRIKRTNITISKINKHIKEEKTKWREFYKKQEREIKK